MGGPEWAGSGLGVGSTAGMQGMYDGQSFGGGMSGGMMGMDGSGMGGMNIPGGMGGSGMLAQGMLAQASANAVDTGMSRAGGMNMGGGGMNMPGGRGGFGGGVPGGFGGGGFGGGMSGGMMVADWVPQPRGPGMGGMHGMQGMQGGDRLNGQIPMQMPMGGAGFDRGLSGSAPQLDSSQLNWQQQMQQQQGGRGGGGPLRPRLRGRASTARICWCSSPCLLSYTSSRKFWMWAKAPTVT